MCIYIERERYKIIIIKISNKKVVYKALGYFSKLNVV